MVISPSNNAIGIFPNKHLPFQIITRFSSHSEILFNSTANVNMIHFREKHGKKHYGKGRETQAAKKQTDK